jgi:hypothetical protein
LDEITKEKQRLGEALARADAQREKLTGRLSELDCGAPTTILPIPAGETEAFAAMPIICKPRSFRTRLKHSFT